MNTDNRLTIWARVVLLGIGFALAGGAQETLPLTERAWIAGRIYGAALQYFAHWQDVPGLDPDVAYRRYLEQVLADGNRRKFARATLEFLASFRNSHTTLIDQEMIQAHGALPFAARYLEGKWVVTESWTAGLKAGDVLERIDGETFEEFFQRHRSMLPASTEGWARRALFARLGDMAPYAYLLPDRFVLGLDGKRQVTVDRTTGTTPAKSMTEGRWLEQGKVAYIRIPSFFAPEYEKRALELLAEFRGAETLILDVRGNTGGNTPGQLTAQLMNRPYRWWTESTTVTLPYFRFRASQGSWELQPFHRPELTWRSPVREPEKGAYAGKLILLVDAACHSACEDFVMPFKDNRRATIVGEATAGSTGQPFILQPGHGMMVFVGAKREMFPDGSQFESVGIRPDVEVRPSAADIRRGEDAVLERALQMIGRG